MKPHSVFCLGWVSAPFGYTYNELEIAVCRRECKLFGFVQLCNSIWWYQSVIVIHRVDVPDDMARVDDERNPTEPSYSLREGCIEYLKEKLQDANIELMGRTLRNVS